MNLQQKIEEKRTLRARKLWYLRILVKLRLRHFAYEDHDAMYGTAMSLKANRLIGRCLTVIAECRGRMS